MKNKLTLLLIAAAIATNSLNAQTWTGAVSSNWNTAANWAPANVPGPSSAVIINNAGLINQPVLQDKVNIASILMTHGILNLNGFTITCTGDASFTGDSLRNGHIIAGDFSQFSNMKTGGKLMLEKNNAITNNIWSGNNKVYNDSLLIVYKGGALIMENAAPDSIFADVRIRLEGNSSLGLAWNSNLFVQKNLIIDNMSKGYIEFCYGAGGTTVINGNLIPVNFSGNHSDVILRRITSMGSNANGVFYSANALVSDCIFNGNISLVADSSATLNITNSQLRSNSNLLQAGRYDNLSGNIFGNGGGGSTTLRIANSTANYWLMTEGNNKFYGNVIFDAGAATIAGSAAVIQNTLKGQDSCFGNVTYLIKNNAALTSNFSGNTYVAGNVIIDAQGASRWIDFGSGNSSSTYSVAGNFTAQNFTPGLGPIALHRVYANGTGSCGLFHAYNASIFRCRFNGDFTLLADSTQASNISESWLLGSNNLFQTGRFDVLSKCLFGKIGGGTTTIRMANNTANSWTLIEGNNKFYGNVVFDAWASTQPGAGTIIQNTISGHDSCFGNVTYLIKNNSALTSNFSGNTYVAGNAVIDAQGASRWIDFGSGNSSSTYSVAGNFTAQNFTPGLGPVALHRVYAAGAGSCGVFNAYGASVFQSSFNGDFTLLADSTQPLNISQSRFLGNNNLFGAGRYDALSGNQFGKDNTGITTISMAHPTANIWVMPEGNNKFYGNVVFDAWASTQPGAGTIIQNTISGQDSCFGNVTYLIKNNSALTSNFSGNTYVAGNVVIDAQGASRWIDFGSGNSSSTYSVAGNFTAQNFTPGLGPVALHRVYAAGAGSCGVFNAYNASVFQSSFNGDFTLLADSTQPLSISQSRFLGNNNLFGAGRYDALSGNRFGKTGSGNSIIRMAHTTANIWVMPEGNNKFYGNVVFDAWAPSSSGRGSIIQQSIMGVDSCFGNLTVNLSGYSAAGLAMSYSTFIGKGLYLNNNSTVNTIIHNTPATAIHFIGSDTAEFLSAGSGAIPELLNIVLNKQGGIRLQSPLICGQTIAFTRGVLLTSPDNPLSLPAGAGITGGWDSSYADGPVIKTGNTAFTFPLGKNNVFAPVSITAPTLATDAFRAQYFNISPFEAGFDTAQHDLTIHHISQREYWLLDRTNGTASPKVSLSWKQKRSGIINVITDLTIARWNGTTWKDEGNSSTSGNTTEGTVQSLNNVSSFSAFALASSSVNNPLPVNFVFFTASLNAEKTVLLKWQTADEINNAFFEVERSSNGINWIKLSKVVPNSMHNYVYTDDSVLNGINYYRVKQTDIDGSYRYTDVRIIKLNSSIYLKVWPNPATDYLFIETPGAAGVAEITDAAGKLTQRVVINNAITSVRLNQLSKGVYSITVWYNTGTFTRRFIKQ